MSKLEPLSVDRFYAQWSGYLRSIDRATVGPVRELVFQITPAPQQQSLTLHKIHITSSEQQIRYLAEVKPPPITSEPNNSSLRYELKLPPHARLLDWRYAASGTDTLSPSLDPKATELTAVDPQTKVVPVEMSPWNVIREGAQTVLYFDGPASGFVVEVDATLPHIYSQASRTMTQTRDSATESTKLSRSKDDGAVSLGWVTLRRVGDSEHSRSQDSDLHDLQITRSVDTELNWIAPVEGQSVDEGFGR